MPGFYLTNFKDTKRLFDKHNNFCIFNKISLDNYVFERNTINKFNDDKCFFENDEYVFIQEGVLLNKKELLLKYKCNTIEELVMAMLINGNMNYWEEFRGSFSGVCYNKKENAINVFTNQIGDAPVFYAYIDGYLFIGSEIHYIIRDIYELNLHITPNLNAIYQMLTYGFMIDNSTYAVEIKKLRGGEFITVFPNGKRKLERYHKFVKEFKNLNSLEEACKELDLIFCNAVKLEYEKDIEYSYRHLADLSGGLDSRMSMWIAHEIGYTNIQLLTYCKANYVDELIAKDIAKYWNDELIIKPLDDIQYLYEIDDTVFLNGGLGLYSGITGGKKLLESLNMNMFGLEHTGQIGDAVIGSFFASRHDKDKHQPTGRYSNKLSDKVKDIEDSQFRVFNDYELFLMYTRAFQGACSTHLIRRNYTEVTSPFLNVELLQYCLNLPDHFRMKHHIYREWIKRYHYDAGNFIWEKIMAKPNECQIICKIKKLIHRGPNRFWRLIGKPEKVTFDMSPIDYWTENNKQFNTYFVNYYESGLRSIKDILPIDAFKDIEFLYNNGTFLEKTQVVTVIASLKLYFGDMYLRYL